MSEPDTSRPTDAFGPPTQWTVVHRAAGLGADPVVHEAWRQLVERYAEPVRHAVRRYAGRGSNADEIADDFFTYLFEQDLLPRADPQAGRFRCFVQGILRRYVLARLRSQRRGGLQLEDDWDVPSFSEEQRLAEQDEAEWAQHVLRSALARLVGARPRDAHVLVRAYGLGAAEAATREALAEELGVKRNALDQALWKARQRLRAAIAEEVRETVATAEDLAAELPVIEARLLQVDPRLFEGLWRSDDREAAVDGDPAADR